MITKKDIITAYDERAKKEREDFLVQASEIIKVINYIKDKFPDAKISDSLKTIEPVIKEDFFKTTYITMDEMCDELDIDPEYIGEHYFGGSIDFWSNGWRIEFNRSGTCKPIFKKQLVETSKVIGYKCT